MKPLGTSGKIPVLVIFAPTATGKTEVTGRLFSDNAPSFFAGKAEIISADSMQVYRSLDIGTAKPNSDFMSHLPHHLIDVADASEQFSASQFIDSADKACEKIYSSGKIPVVCGGTAFYIKNFIFGLPVTPESDEKIRRELKERLERDGTSALYKELCSLDSVSAQKIHPNDAYRICRALEVYHSSGKPLSEFEIPSAPREKYDFLTIYLFRSREELYERINFRVLKMFEEGLFDEMKNLIQSGYTQNMPGMSAIGYREFFTAGENPLDMFNLLDENFTTDGVPFFESPRFLVWKTEIKRQIQKDTRHYAKKQITFFQPIINLYGNPANVHIVGADDIDTIETLTIDYFSYLGHNYINSH